jgi:hypothetical protein
MPPKRKFVTKTQSRIWRSMKVNGIQLHGIHPRLKKAFYPKYEFKEANIDHAKHKTTTGGYKRVKGSMRLGRGFDTAVGQVVRLLRKYPSLSVGCFLEARRLERHESKLTAADYRTATRLLYRRNPYLRMLLALLIEKKMLPIATQVPVKHGGLKLKTWVDLVVYDTKKNKVRPIELKAGYEGYLEKSTRYPMNYPFQDKPDYPLNQHFLQTATTGELYTYNHPAPEIVGAPMLLIFQTAGIKEPVIPKWIKQRMPQMLDVLKNLPD